MLRLMVGESKQRRPMLWVLTIFFLRSLGGISRFLRAGTRVHRGWGRVIICLLGTRPGLTSVEQWEWRIRP